MKILAAGDLHNDADSAQKLAEKAAKEQVDLIILCGDITFQDEPTQNIISPFIKRNQKVIFVPGNHESFATADFLAEFYGIKNLHGYYAKYKDIGFFGCGGSNIGINQLSEQEMFNLLKQGFEKLNNSKKKIMITHTHPSNTKMEKLSQFVVGSKGIEQAIKQLQPDLLICSHVHEAHGLEEKLGKTKIVNVGREGKIINI